MIISQLHNYFLHCLIDHEDISATLYRVSDRITLRVDETSSSLDALMLEYNVQTAAFITTDNPRSQLLSDEENRLMQRRFETYLNDLEIPYVPMTTLAPDGTWPEEHGFLLLGVTSFQARSIGRMYNQNAILWMELGKSVQLVVLCEE